MNQDAAPGQSEHAMAGAPPASGPGSPSAPAPLLPDRARGPSFLPCGPGTTRHTQAQALSQGLRQSRRSTAYQTSSPDLPHRPSGPWSCAVGCQPQGSSQLGKCSFGVMKQRFSRSHVCFSMPSPSASAGGWRVPGAARGVRAFLRSQKPQPTPLAARAYDPSNRW